MPKNFSKKEAISFLGLDEKTFDNYFKNAKEFPPLDRDCNRGRFYFSEDLLKEWKIGFGWSMVHSRINRNTRCIEEYLNGSESAMTLAWPRVD